MYLFAYFWYPEMFEVRIMLQFLVLCYGYLGDGMDNAAVVLLDVNDGPNPLQLGCHFEGFESHDVMHSLDGNVTRQVSVDKTIDCRGGVEDLVAGRS
jgi:hypothetical protein